ncbi:aldehyde dehydrogenase family protein [Aestuariivirga litoralis]|uniref:aldehyde dehydrogenase family protein n=1 Tax=Aestuariivirga litoralis TaxID=2650924 RepID=UPI0018C4E793|nr:aldehyde dehydrogenase family protein [Aestuariivirga litoralis]MBG1232887.1 aldehyde dehydrogenase family protein [Aestuariivirga litoralis]
MAAKQNFISGKWVDGSGVTQNINPSDISDVVGDYTQASKDQTQEAIAAAKAAAPAWGLATPQARADALDMIGTEILARKQEIGTLLSREEGKTLPNGIGEVTRAGQIFKFFAQEALRVEGTYLNSLRPGMDVTITREPMGVVGLITPWNFPAAIPAWKIAPALAFGNAVVFKPADLVPGTAWALAEIISRSGIPAGVFNLVMGRGSVVGQTLLDSRDVNALSFTGSVQTGAKVAAAVSARGGKFQLEMGGKNPLIVLDDANLDAAVAGAVDGAFFQQGQRCTASSRLIVHAKIHDAFVEKTVAAIKALKVDHALKEGSQIGPVVDETQMKQDEDYIRIAREEGAELAWGGERLNRETKGFYLSPALFTRTTNNMRINREEVFGPVASVIKVDSYDEALSVANDTEFGLSSGIYTGSLKTAKDFQRKAQAGMVMVNAPTAGVDYHVPFGGRKGSSIGAREQGRYAVEFYTTVKTAYVNAG